MTSITKEITQTVRASVNERQFFRNMGQAYASNFSFIGEVMQNARRAGASSVQFEASFEKRRLEIIEDGCGIEDFQNLIELATSGWESEEVQLSEKPFGMGLFSLFYACDCVTIRSRGQILTLCLDDIVSKREVHVTKDTEPVLKGTRIVLDHLKDGLMNTNRWVDGFQLTKEGEPSWNLYEAVIFRAAGFDIPVVLNGSPIPQPDARRNIKGQITSIGFVCLTGIHTEIGHIDISASETKYFLQGLPIATRCSSRAKNIVHLDSERFVPLMPDRAQLQDHDTQITAVNAVVKGILLEHIVGMKASMESAVFVEKYFQLSTKNGWSYLLNDVAYLPPSLFSRVVCVSIACDDIYKHVSQHAKCISRQDITTGSVRAWRDSALSTTDGPWTATLLKVMQREDIFEVDTSALDKKHWIFDCAPSINDFKVSTIAHGVQGSISMDVQWDSCELTLVDSVTVNIASKLNPDFKLVHELTKDWLVVPANQCELDDSEDYGDFTGETICYFTTGDASPDHPCGVFENFRNDRQDYVESWNDDACDRWNSAMNGLMGTSLSKTVASALYTASQTPTPNQGEHLSVVRVIQDWHTYAKKSISKFDVIDLQGPDFWQVFAGHLDINANPELSERLRTAFQCAVKPNELIIINGARHELCEAAGYSFRGEGGSTFVLLPGEEKVDFDAENHNYLGLFSSREAALDEVYDNVVIDTIEWHKLSLNQFDSLLFPEQWRLVKQAHAQRIEEVSAKNAAKKAA